MEHRETISRGCQWNFDNASFELNDCRLVGHRHCRIHSSLSLEEELDRARLSEWSPSERLAYEAYLEREYEDYCNYVAEQQSYGLVVWVVDERFEHRRR